MESKRINYILKGLLMKIYQESFLRNRLCLKTSGNRLSLPTDRIIGGTWKYEGGKMHASIHNGLSF